MRLHPDYSVGDRVYYTENEDTEDTGIVTQVCQLGDLGNVAVRWDGDGTEDIYELHQVEHVGVPVG